MWSYVKRLEYPVNIKNPNPAAAKVILDALGGPDGELGAANRYLSQRFTMPYNEVVGILTDIGTEELGHVEMVSSIIYQLTRNLSVKGDVLADLNEDLAAEQKARVCYDNLLRQMDDPDVCDTLRFLRERELVHYQRFGDALRISQDRMDSSNFYGWNPEFDRGRRER